MNDFFGLFRFDGFEYLVRVFLTVGKSKAVTHQKYLSSGAQPKF